MSRNRGHSPFSYLTVFLLLFIPGIAVAQKPANWCGTMEVLERLQREDPSLSSRMVEIENAIQAEITRERHRAPPIGPILVIPVVVHVVYSQQSQNIPESQILSQINVLNEDYRRFIGTPGHNTNPVGDDTRLEFRLAQRNPQGRVTGGIIRKSTNVREFTDDDKVKFASKGGSNAWDSTKYLNIWVCNLGNKLLGYATFPGAKPDVDGVVVTYTAFGDKVGSVKYPFDQGRTTTHEVGHWLNLWHTFQGGCKNDNCTKDGDRCCDTPPVAVATSGCPPSRDSCSVRTQTENYMDYTDDRCMNLMTMDQTGRVHATIKTVRKGLSSSPGLENYNFTLEGLHKGDYSYVSSDTVKAVRSFSVPSTSSVTVRAKKGVSLQAGVQIAVGARFNVSVWK